GVPALVVAVAGAAVEVAVGSAWKRSTMGTVSPSTAALSPPSSVRSTVPGGSGVAVGVLPAPGGVPAVPVDVAIPPGAVAVAVVDTDGLATAEPVGDAVTSRGGPAAGAAPPGASTAQACGPRSAGMGVDPAAGAPVAEFVALPALSAPAALADIAASAAAPA